MSSATYALQNPTFITILYSPQKLWSTATILAFVATFSIICAAIAPLALLRCMRASFLRSIPIARAFGIFAKSLVVLTFADLAQQAIPFRLGIRVTKPC